MWWGRVIDVEVISYKTTAAEESAAVVCVEGTGCFEEGVLSYQRHSASFHSCLVYALVNALVLDNIAIHAPFTTISIFVSTVPLAIPVV